jgi:type I restriction enzyme M protein
MEATLLHCPIRGGLRVKQRASDDLTFTEEKHRIDAIRYLLQRRYPRENFGIEATLFRLGRDGRNSFRTDFAIYDRPFNEIRDRSPEDRIGNVRVLAEIKRENSTAEEAKATQVRSALRLVPDTHTLGVYWDDIEQRFFFRRTEGRTEMVHEAPISKIPDWGAEVGSTQLTYADLDPTKDLIRIFDEIADALHPYIGSLMARYEIIQQILLTKIHDENTHRIERRLDLPLAFQDFSVEALADSEVMRRMNTALAQAAGHYNMYLPPNNTIKSEFMCPPEALKNISRILAPTNILASRAQVIQGFYMKFAKGLYKWDLGQYFTPHEVIDFIVDIVNPQPGEHIHDPACGSADFLISAFRKAGPTMQNCVWGADSSEEAVQISVLNMVLNGDGKTQIHNYDSLQAYSPTKAQTFSVVLCNPPFGTKIVERRFEVLRKFDMGYKWMRANDGFVAKTDEARASQQTGILFAELCVRLAKPGGRVAIILPNGYLGNKGAEYVALRDWLIRNARIVALMAFPRFTFKKSGADVSASVLVLERRTEPLQSVQDSDDHSFFVGNLESVGWRAGDKKAVPLYVRDLDTGEILLDDDNEPVLDADFAAVLSEFLRSPAPDYFPWAAIDRSAPRGAQTASIDIREVVSRGDLLLDPKRYSSKYLALRQSIVGSRHVRLGDVFEPVTGQNLKRKREKTYKYVEIERIGVGEYDYVEQRGWQLAQRAKLVAKKGDLFIPHLWGCAGKWFIAAGDADNVVVTNGCAHFRLRDGQEASLPSVLLGMCAEAFSVQIRAASTGSDGLAEISDDDLADVRFPLIDDEVAVAAVRSHYEKMLSGQERFCQFGRQTILAVKGYPIPPARKSHGALV